MPKNIVSDLITDQEMAFARLILSGTMTDREAAQAAGLHPSTAAYTKTRPRVRAYMVEHRAAVEQQLVQQETEGLHSHGLERQRVLARLWAIADLSPEMTRGSITSQVKALAMIVAIQGLIAERHPGSARHETSTQAIASQFYKAEWRRQQEDKNVEPPPAPASVPEEEDPGLAQPEPDPGSALAGRTSPSAPVPSPAPEPVFDSAPDTRIPFFIRTGPHARRR